MKPTPQAIENAAQNIYTATPRNRPYEQLSLAKKNALRAQATKVLTGNLGDMVLVPKAFLSRLREYKNQIDALYPRGAYDVELLFATACTTAWPVIDAMLAAAEGEPCK